MAEIDHDKILEYGFRLGRLESNAESEKDTISRRNTGMDTRHGALEERVRQLELSQSGQKVSLGTLERVFWIVVAAVVGFFSRSHN